MKIVLMGYMGSGKSTIGQNLALKKQLPFVDLDNYIEIKENKTINRIFEEKGKIYFRRKENQYLKELLNEKDDFVLSLGGGTPCYANNMELILTDKNTKSVYLQANINTLTKRLSKNKENRPLIANLSEENLTEFIAKHLFERRFFYEKASVKIVVDEKSINEIVTEIMDKKL